MNRSTIAAAGAGLVAGIIGSVVANAWLSKQRPPQTVTYVPAVGPNQGPQQAFAALALAAAARREQPAGSAPLAPPAGGPPLPPKSEPEMKEFHDALAKHAREPESPVWAERVRKGLGADLEKLSTAAKFSSFELKCRSKTCAGVIEWPSLPTAFQSMPGLLHNQYTINSAIRFGLPERAGDGPYRVGVIFVPAPGT